MTTKIRKLDIPEPKKDRKPHGYWTKKFKPEYSNIATNLVAAGFTEKDLAHTFSVTPTAIESWKNSFPEFELACKEGKKTEIKRLVAKVLQDAAGYEYTTKKTRTIRDKDGEIIKIEETEFNNHQPANNNLLIFLLCNLSNQLGLGTETAWQSKQRMEIENKTLNIELTGETTREEIAKFAGRLLELESNKKQVESKVID